MASGTIFTVDNGGTVTRMRPGTPVLEADIQGLIARHPDMIGQEGHLLSICQEASIADNEGGSGRWSLDNLFVTKGAVPVLVECKRASDPRIRREVVAQMFEYAANCTNWRDGEMARLFAQACESDGQPPAEVLAAFLNDGTVTDEFWARVDANLKSGNIRLLFVADRIPPELARMVEFLNEQMRAEVLAVELNWFVDTAGARALVPRIIGATERAAARRSPSATPSLPSLSKEEWIEQRARPQGDAAARVAQIFFEFADSIGGDLNLRNSWASLLVPTNQGGSLHVLAVYPSGKYAVNLDAARRGASLDDDGVRAAIMPLTRILGPLSTEKLTGYPSFKADAILDVSQRDTILDAMRQFAEVCVQRPLP